MPKKSFNLHLAKEDIANFDDILSESALEKLAVPTTVNLEIPDFADGAKIYVFTGFPRTPDWLRDLQGVFQVQANVLTSSASGILAFRQSGRIFAVTFAQGWALLEDRAFEKDFGLRTSINALDQEKLKKLERNNLADALRGSSLSPFQRNFQSFGLDDALDLVRTISGRTRDGVSADAISGSSSLKWNAEIGLLDLPAVADEALALFQSNNYIGTTFEVLDLLRPVVDIDLCENLDLEMIQSIINGAEEFELGLPTDSSVDGIYYKFEGLGLRRAYPDLMMQNYVQALGGDLANLDVEKIKNDKIKACFEQDGLPDKRWSVHSALIGSISFDNGLYAINEGCWYRVDEAFKESVSQGFTDVVTGWHQPPIPLRRIASGRDTRYQTEASYNEETAANTGLVLMDRKLIEIEGVDRSSFELCDLLDLNTKRLIHVKKSSRKSSVLSHFFKQGSHSAQYLKLFPACEGAIRDVLFTEFGQLIAQQFDAAIDAEDPWTIEFWIADSPRANGDFNIPFFSKITLRDEVRKLRSMNFEVRLKFIGLQAQAI